MPIPHTKTVHTDNHILTSTSHSSGSIDAITPPTSDIKIQSGNNGKSHVAKNHIKNVVIIFHTPHVIQR